MQTKVMAFRCATARSPNGTAIALYTPRPYILHRHACENAVVLQDIPNAELQPDAIKAIESVCSGKDSALATCLQKNLCRISTPEGFELTHSETGTPYGKTEAQTVDALPVVLTLPNDGGRPLFTRLQFDKTPFVEDGINFAGKIIFSFASG